MKYVVQSVQHIQHFGFKCNKVGELMYSVGKKSSEFDTDFYYLVVSHNQLFGRHVNASTGITKDMSIEDLYAQLSQCNSSSVDNLNTLLGDMLMYNVIRTVSLDDTKTRG